MTGTDKFVWVHFPKTGGHYVKWWLQRWFDVKDVNPPKNYFILTSDNHLPLSCLEDKTLFKWGMIRNPFAWYVSWYGDNGEGMTFRSFIKNRLEEKEDLFHFYVDFSVMRRLDIGLFTWWFIRMYCDYENIFNMTSVDDLDLKKECLLDELLPYEEFNDAIINMFEKHLDKLSDEQIHSLKTGARLNVQEHPYWKEVWDEELVKLVEHKDRLIFKMFPHYLYERSSKRTLG